MKPAKIIDVHRYPECKDTLADEQSKYWVDWIRAMFSESADQDCVAAPADYWCAGELAIQVGADKRDS